MARTVLKASGGSDPVAEPNQDHRGIKRLTKPGMGFYSFHTARRTLAGFEIMNMIRKGQVDGVARGDVIAQRNFLAQIFSIAA